MKLSVKLLLLLCSFLPFASTAQNIEMRNFDLPEKPAIHTMTPEEEKEPVVCISDRRVIEYIFNKDNDLETYTTHYRLVHINESKSVEQYNKIYIPVASERQLIAFKARAVSKDGKTKEMLRNEMKPVTEDGQLYMSLAIDGVEKGSEVEFFYTLRRRVSYAGSERIQTSDYARKVEITILSPENLVMAAKAYNTDIQPTDTIIDKKNRIDITFENVKPIEDEKYSNTEAIKIRLEYRLDKNLVKGNGPILTFADAGKYYYGLYARPEKNEMKDVEKAYDKLKLNGKNDEEKIRGIEVFLKNNFNIQENADVASVSEALKTKIADIYTINKLAFLLSKAANVKCEIVLTINRYKKLFDPEFESWNYLDEMLFYYPSIDMYMMPTNIISRVGEPPLQFAGANGLFIREVGIGDITSAVSNVKKIADLDKTKSYDNLDIKVTFSSDMTKANQQVVHDMNGQTSNASRPFYFYADKDKRGELLEDWLKNGVEDAVVTNTSAQNENMNSEDAKKPFIIKGEVSSASLIEKADNTFLFKVGEIIGPQVEMYQEKPRQNQIDLDFPHSLDRKITIKIPDGYVAKGLDALKLNITHGAAANPDMGFVSDYKLNGNVLEITIHEFYYTMYYPISEFEQFRNVINAAADFNKVTIALEKKS